MRHRARARLPAWGLPAAVVRFTVLTPARAGSISVYRGDQAWNGAASISFGAGTSVQQQLTTVLGPDRPTAAAQQHRRRR